MYYVVVVNLSDRPVGQAFNKNFFKKYLLCGEKKMVWIDGLSILTGHTRCVPLED